MKTQRVPIAAAKEISEKYNKDQVLISVTTKPLARFGGPLTVALKSIVKWQQEEPNGSSRSC